MKCQCCRPTLWNNAQASLSPAPASPYGPIELAVEQGDGGQEVRRVLLTDRAEDLSFVGREVAESAEHALDHEHEAAVLAAVCLVLQGVEGQDRHTCRPELEDLVDELDPIEGRAVIVFSRAAMLSAASRTAWK